MGQNLATNVMSTVNDSKFSGSLNDRLSKFKSQSNRLSTWFTKSDLSEATALHKAILRQDLLSLQRLLMNRSNPNRSEFDFLVERPADQVLVGGQLLTSATPLMLAVLVRNQMAIKELTHNFMSQILLDPNLRSGLPGQVTALHIAVGRGDLKTIERLLVVKANPATVRDARGLTAFELAIELDNMKVVELLVCHHRPRKSRGSFIFDFMFPSVSDFDNDGKSNAIGDTTLPSVSKLKGSTIGNGVRKAAVRFYFEHAVRYWPLDMIRHDRQDRTIIEAISEEYPISEITYLIHLMLPFFESQKKVRLPLTSLS